MSGEHEQPTLDPEIFPQPKVDALKVTLSGTVEIPVDDLCHVAGDEPEFRVGEVVAMKVVGVVDGTGHGLKRRTIDGVSFKAPEGRLRIRVDGISWIFPALRDSTIHLEVPTPEEVAAAAHHAATGE